MFLQERIFITNVNLKIMKLKVIILIGTLAAMAIPMVASAQAVCTKIVGTTIEIMGLELHHEYWCCSGPEGCFWDTYVI